MEGQTVLEGAISIQAALESENRTLYELYIDREKRSRSTDRLKQLARSVNLPINYVATSTIDEIAAGSSHGGVVAIAGERRFHDIQHLASSTAVPFIVMLDGIEDPFNFGYAIRALYAAGVSGLIVRPRNWFSASGTVARASAGASERIFTAQADSAEVAAHRLGRFGLQVACTGIRGATPIYEADLSVPLFLVIGGEKRGVARSFIEKSDLLLKIPYGRSFNQSIGTAAAAAILAFEVMRQRQLK